MVWVFDRNCKDVQTPAHFLILTISQRSNNIYFSALKSLENFSPMLDWSTFYLSFYNKHFSDLRFHLAEPRNKVSRSCQEWLDLDGERLSEDQEAVKMLSLSKTSKTCLFRVYISCFFKTYLSSLLSYTSWQHSNCQTISL